MSTAPTPEAAAARRLVEQAGPLPDHLLRSIARQLQASRQQAPAKKPA